MFDNPFAMVVAIVAIVTFSKVWQEHAKARARGPSAGERDADRAAMQTQIDRLNERVKVLERLVLDDDRQLSAEIERLRRTETT